MSKVCIIVPIYNVERYICRCLDSILHQTFRDFDLVLVDDGSPDKCGEICECYAKRDVRIHVIHQENRGLSAARNTGIEWALIESECEWITFIDSDDWIHTTFLEQLLGAAQKDKTDIIIGEALWTKGEPLPEAEYRPSVIWKTEDYYLQHTVNANVAWGKLYKKKCFHSIRYPEGKIHEDEYVTYRVLFGQKYISVVDQKLYAYFQNDSGITRGKWTPSRLDGLTGIEQQIKYFELAGYNEIAHKRFNSFLNNYEKSLEYIRLSGLREKEKRRYINQVNHQLRRVLLLYCKYGWLPFHKSERNKRLYSNAFAGIRVLREIWGKVKYAVTHVPVISNLWGYCTKGWRRISDIQAAARYVRSIMNKKAVLLQTPLHGNIGDHAIAEAENQLLNSLGITYCDFPWTIGREKIFARVTSKKKIILITGGGYLGQLWPNEEQRFRDTLKAFRNNKVIVFPHTLFFDMESEEGRRCFHESKEIYETHLDLTIFAREEHTYQFLREFFPRVKTEIVPDMVMMLKWQRDDCLRDGVLICLRKDKERKMSEEVYQNLIVCIGKEYSKLKVTDTVITGRIFPEQREKAVHEKLAEFASFKLAVTDRLHGMIFAAITETPCIVLDSLSPKIRGCYEWIKDLDYIRFAENVDDVPDIIEDLKTVTPHYNREKIEEAMQPLYNVLIEATK